MSLLTAQPPAVFCEPKLRLLAVSVIGPSVEGDLGGRIEIQLDAALAGTGPAVSCCVAWRRGESRVEPGDAHIESAVARVETPVRSLRRDRAPGERSLIDREGLGRELCLPAQAVAVDAPTVDGHSERILQIEAERGELRLVEEHAHPVSSPLADAVGRVGGLTLRLAQIERGALGSEQKAAVVDQELRDRQRA